MQTGVIIVGQGLCGTWLSYWLQKLGVHFLVIDDGKPNSATRAASGIINPVTGRRMVKTWMADQLLTFAWQAYGQMGSELDETLISKLELIDFFSAPDRRIAFQKRSAEWDAYLHWPQNENSWNAIFNYPFGYGIVSPVYQVNLQLMQFAWRQKLRKQNRHIEEQYEPSQLKLLQNLVEYKGIRAEKIIFCDGIAAMEQPFFNLLPFAFNKGEALIIDVPGLPRNFLYKKTDTITPWQNGLFWVGSTYNREYKDDQPSVEFYEHTNAWLQNFLKLPFSVRDHLAAVRPTTVERRPFAGFHPNYSNVGILNGMGTKGVSLAPFLAKQLAENIVNGTQVLREADVSQYGRILARKSS